MSQLAADPNSLEQRRNQWVERCESLVKQIETWATQKGLATSRETRSVTERTVGSYQVPLLRVRFPMGEVHVIPVGLNVIGADGRIDIEAFPTLNRVKLVGREAGWEIYTDSNVPLRQPWTADTFMQLASDLLA